MSESASHIMERVELTPRVIGRHGDPQAGAKLLVVAGIHGNERAGIAAARRVLERLAELRPPCRGEMVALAGNTRALAQGRRYLRRDLNRQWTPERVASIRRVRTEDLPEGEDRELRELLTAIEAELAETRGDAYFLDLHTTSAPGTPFLLFGDTLRNRAFARPFPLPVILGLEEQLDGTLLEYVNNLGYVTLGCEGGQHDAESSVDHHAAVLWIALVQAGILRPEVAGDLEGALDLLRRARGKIPRRIEVRYRHAIRPRDGFRMEPGFRTLQPVRAGELLARDARGEVRARWSGWILMPLYQGLGNDGFFLAREIQPFWLGLSAVLRRLRLGRLLPLLPGVSRHRDREEALVVDTRIVRWFPLDLFHLFGFRKLRWQGPVLVVSRRRYDSRRPAPRH
jgi:predicted deacylase